MKTYSELVTEYGERLLNGASTNTIVGVTGYKGILTEFLEDLVNNEVVFSATEFAHAVQKTHEANANSVRALETIAELLDAVNPGTAASVREQVARIKQAQAYTGADLSSRIAKATNEVFGSDSQ